MDELQRGKNTQQTKTCWCSDCSFIIITVEEFGVYEPVRMTLQLDIDRESVMGLSVLTGATSTTMSEVSKLTYIPMHCTEIAPFFSL